MSVVLDQDTVVLDKLDFETPCEFPRAETHAAEVIMQCRHCGAHAIICRAHLDRLRRRVEQARPPRVVTCITCHAEENDLDDLIEVVPL